MKVIYIHIPKCAGNSVIDGILATIQPKKSAYYEGAPAQQAVDDIYWKASLATKIEGLLGMQQFFIQYSLRSGCDFVYGHLPFSPLAETYYPEYKWVTCVREPYERMRSQLMYLAIRYGDEVARTHGIEDDGDKLVRVLEVLYADKELCWRSAHAMSIQLGGLGYQVKPDLENAIGNAAISLQKFAAIGFTDRMDAFYEDLRQLLGAEVPRYERNQAKQLVAENEELEAMYGFFTEGRKRELEGMLTSDFAIYRAIEEWVKEKRK